MTEPRVRKVVARLLAWYRGNARDLPWRRQRDAYAVWVSEVMLQQTQVKTVIPYWRRWMRLFPSIESLARARWDRVLKVWEGLGYYRRARCLHQGAKEIVARHHGKFPERFDEVLALPGVGRYTAGAICSIAFGQAHPALDGNVARVLARQFGIAGDPGNRGVNERLWNLATKLVSCAGAIKNGPDSRCSELNQALMELGALVCVPRGPKCGECPVRTDCVAARTGRVEALPGVRRRAVSTRRRFIAVVAASRGRYLVRRRPEGGVNAGLWEFPNVEVDAEVESVKDAEDSFDPVASWAKEELGIHVGGLERFCTVHHCITRYRLSLEVYLARAREGRLSTRALESDAHWVRRDQLTALPMASAHRKVAQRLRATKA